MLNWLRNLLGRERKLDGSRRASEEQNMHSSGAPSFARPGRVPEKRARHTCLALPCVHEL